MLHQESDSSEQDDRSCGYHLGQDAIITIASVRAISECRGALRMIEVFLSAEDFYKLGQLP